MQVHFSNPGNMLAALVFSKDSVNILEKEGLFIDPMKEKAEPEYIKLDLSSSK